MASGRPSIVLLARDARSTRIVYHRLCQTFEVRRIVVEDSVSRRVFITRRVKRLGLRPVLGQVLFQMLAVPYLTRASRARADEIMRVEGLRDDPLNADLVTRISSVNSESARELLRSLAPDVVVLNGTRIVSQETLSSVPATFVNVHAGITPAYRGVHGGYWALAQGDRSACGVTVHVVDEGVDTGPILAQATIEPIGADSFVTYPLLQLAAGLPLLVEALERLGAGETCEVDPLGGPSRMWSHPTLAQYFGGRRRVGVK